MTNIYQFPRRPALPFIEIDGGVIHSAVRTMRVGGVEVPYDAGTYRFFVTLIAGDGTEVGLWHGSDYEDAVRQAEEFRIELQVSAEVLDRVAGWPQ